MADDEQTFIEVNRFFEEEDDLEAVEATESFDSIGVYPALATGTSQRSTSSRRTTTSPSNFRRT